jgi:hypothetical protein
MEKKVKDFLWTSELGTWPEVWVAKWTDPTSETAKVWMSPEDVKKTNPLPCLAAGFMVQRTDEYVKLAVTVSANGFCGQIITIPTRSLTFFGKLADIGKGKK